MGGLFGGGGGSPSVQSPAAFPPPPPILQSPQGVQAMTDTQKRAAGMGGQARTIATGPMGLMAQPQTTYKSLLGS